MYAFAPVSLAALHKIDGDRPRSYRVPMPRLVLPAAFCSANLIMYWGGFDTNWKLALAMLAGLALFAIGAWRSAHRRARARSETPSGWGRGWAATCCSGGSVATAAAGTSCRTGSTSAW